LSVDRGAKDAGKTDKALLRAFIRAGG